MFFISGPTGAGKTSVLDAMCFALSARQPGPTERVIRFEAIMRRRRCRRVVFDFDFAGTRCNVSRSRNRCDRSRAARLTEQAPKATLWSAGLSTPDADDGDVLATGKRDVTAALVEVLGFQAEQFRQVVMIPQGEFRKLLSAEVNVERLRKLFGTVRLQRVAEVLKRRQKAVDVRLKRRTTSARLFSPKRGAGVEERARIEQGQREVARLAGGLGLRKTEQTARLALTKAAAGNRRS